VEQGSIIQIIGGDATCKRTILRLCSRSIFPNSGEVIVPTHLRTMFVSETPDMLKKPLWENLVLACSHRPRPERVLEIVDKLQMEAAKKVLAKEIKLKACAEVKESELSWAGRQDTVGDLFAVQNWEMLPKTEIAKINLARALIMNPELLIITKPTGAYVEKETKDLILALILEHRNQRGVAMGATLSTAEDAEMRRSRRPRTVFVTTSEREGRIPGAVVWTARSTNAAETGALFTIEAERPPSSRAPCGTPSAASAAACGRAPGAGAEGLRTPAADAPDAGEPYSPASPGSPGWPMQGAGHSDTSGLADA